MIQERVQLRNEAGAITFVDTLDQAFLETILNPSIWKISFQAETGERIRLVRQDDVGWVYENIQGDRRIDLDG